jgi:hypothetical protein
VAGLWDGQDLKCTFRRTVDDSLYRRWMEIVQRASTIIFKEEEYNMIWSFTSHGGYASQSLYKIINFRGVLPVVTP